MWHGSDVCVTRRIALYFRKRAVSPRQISLCIRQRAQYFCERALYIRKRALYPFLIQTLVHTIKHSYILHRTATSSLVSHPQELFTHGKRALYFCKRALYFCKRDLYTAAKPYIPDSSKHTYVLHRTATSSLVCVIHKNCSPMAKEPYISVKEPYVSAKETYIPDSFKYSCMELKPRPIRVDISLTDQTYTRAYTYICTHRHTQIQIQTQTQTQTDID